MGQRHPDRAGSAVDVAGDDLRNEACTVVSVMPYMLISRGDPGLSSHVPRRWFQRLPAEHHHRQLELISNPADHDGGKPSQRHLTVKRRDRGLLTVAAWLSVLLTRPRRTSGGRCAALPAAAKSDDRRGSSTSIPTKASWIGTV